MNKGRLMTLAVYLESQAIEPNNFNLETWANSVEGEYAPIPEGKIRTCGYTACAIGHATAIPSFQAAGFKANKYGAPRYDDKTRSLGAWDAVCFFFELSRKQAESLFSEVNYTDGNKTTKEQVAARIRQFVKEDK